MHPPRSARSWLATLSTIVVIVALFDVAVAGGAAGRGAVRERLAKARPRLPTRPDGVKQVQLTFRRRPLTLTLTSRRFQREYRAYVKETPVAERMNATEYATYRATGIVPPRIELARFNGRREPEEALSADEYERYRSSGALPQRVQPMSVVEEKFLTANHKVGWMRENAPAAARSQSKQQLTRSQRRRRASFDNRGYFLGFTQAVEHIGRLQKYADRHGIDLSRVGNWFGEPYQQMMKDLAESMPGEMSKRPQGLTRAEFARAKRAKTEVAKLLAEQP